MSRTDFMLGDLGHPFSNATNDAEEAHVAKRIWRHDASLWKPDELAQNVIRNSLGWLTVADEMIGVADELGEFAELIRSRGFKHVMVCGMGGSSLCPEVLAQTFGRQNGSPELLVLDSTDPDVIAGLMQRVDIRHCLFIIASKSGTTTEPTVFYKFWFDQAAREMTSPGENFLAITDPGSPLIEAATELGFQRIFLNQPDIGGRYSALSYFGMVPAALMGLDLKKLLGRAKEMSQACSAVMSSQSNPGLKLGLAIGECALHGRDKLTFVIDPEIASLGLWIEQLVAESTGKEGKGVLPVAGEDLGEPGVYGDDRVFVSISLGETSAETRSKLDALSLAGHPVIHRELSDPYDLGAEFFLWEFATACVGWRLGINPFDQPNVQESKDATKELLSSFVTDGRLPEQQALVTQGPLTLFTGLQNLRNDSLVTALRAFMGLVQPHDYLAFLNYFEESAEVDAAFQELRRLLRLATKCATTVGFGPRFLHSTGQLHKGGPDTGVFFQITAGDRVDFEVPGEPYSFNVLKQAQALGDFRSLTSRGRRAVRIDLGADVTTGLRLLQQQIDTALQSANSTNP